MRLFSQVAATFLFVVLSGLCVAAPAPPSGKPKLLASYKSDHIVVYGLAFSPDGKTLASAGGEGFVKLWDVSSRAEIRKIEANKRDVAKNLTGRVHSVAFSPDGKILASASNDRKMKLWDVRTGECNGVISFCNGTQVGFSPDGKSVSANGQIWDLTTKKEQRPIKLIRGGTRVVTFLKDTPLGATATDWPSPPNILLYDLKSGEKQMTLEGHTKLAISMAFSPDGKSLASLSYDNTIRVWDVATGKNKATFDKLPKWRGGSLNYSPNGKVLAVRYCAVPATACDCSDILLLDGISGKILATLKGHKAAVVCIAFSRNGRLLASGDNNGMIFLWEMPARY